MAIRLQDDEPMNYQEQFGDSQVVLVPIHENRIGEEGYEQMLREARLFADTYDKILVGVLEAYCTYSSHPILGNIPVLPAGQAGSGTVPRPLTLFESPEEGWRAVAQGLAELLEPYRPFFQPGIRGRVFFDTEKNAWRFDKGRKDGVSIWHREVSLDTENGPLDIGIEEVFSDYAILRRTAGMEEGPDKVFNATVNTEPRWEINVLIQGHAGNSSLVRELQNSQALQQFGWRFTNEIPRLDYVLHLTQTHAYLTRAFENPNDEDEELYLNPYRPLTKPIPLTSGKETIEKFLKQAANREYLRRLEAPYSEQLGEEALEIKVFHSQGTDWEELSPEDGVVSVPLWAKPLKGGVSYQNTIRIQAANRSERTLYVSAFLLSAYFGSDGGLIEGGQIELKPGEAVQLFERGDGRIPVELNGRTLAYNLPSEPWEVKFLASPRPLYTDGYWMGNLPGPPGSFFLEEEGYFMEKAREMERIEPPEGQWVAPLLKLRLQNPAYNRPRYDMLTNLLRRPDAEVFLRALYFESHALAPRYWLKAGIELQGGDTESQVDPDTIPFEAYTYAPDGLAILEYQLEQLAPQLRGRPENGIVVALGDSWYNQAQPVDIAEELKGNYLVVKAPLEDWGQLEEAVRRVEKYMANLPSSVTLLLSADGARIFDHPAAFLRESPPERDENIGLILRDQFSLVLGDLRESWLNGLKYLAGFGGRLQVIVHGYDYFPTEAYGSRLGDFPPEWRRNVISFLVDSLNARLEAAIRDMGSENIHYLDFRNTLESNEWRSGVLPGPSGFGKLAGQIGLFISRRYSLGEEPFPGTAYFLWQAARISDTKEDYQVLIDAYPEGEHRPWAEERLREVRSGKSEAGSRGAGWEALQALRRRANDLISSNQLGELFELLDREL
ncbi:MAG: hypothetical protein KDD10_23930, partial [Phaeodactylibacter sp.]|nr:hypothetical protein [Phaeodactylibacter sp.]